MVCSFLVTLIGKGDFQIERSIMSLSAPVSVILTMDGGFDAEITWISFQEVQYRLFLTEKMTFKRN